MSRVEKTVFISYRRVSVPWALAIFQNLTQQGYDVFFDFAGISSGDFETVIVGNIRARAHFLVLLTPSALERCNEPSDWLRREIETALDSGRNIVPLMLEGFDFNSPAIADQLSGKLAALKRYNAIRVPADYFSEAMERLREKFLNVALDAALQPVSGFAQEAAQEQQAAANNAPVVKGTELRLDSSTAAPISKIFEQRPASDLAAVRDVPESTSQGSFDSHREPPRALSSTNPSGVEGHYYEASAHALSGVLTQPFSHVIRPLQYAKLSGGSGFFSERSRGFSLEGFVSFASGHTHVAGSSNSEVWNTSATATLEKLNLFDVVTADAVVARISIDLARDDNTLAKVSFIGTKFDNLRIGSTGVELRLETGVFAHDPSGLPNEARKGTLVTDLSSPPSFRNSIALPGLGRLFIAELQLEGDSYQLTMLRLIASSGYHGSITAVTCQASVGPSRHAVQG